MNVPIAGCQSQFCLSMNKNRNEAADFDTWRGCDNNNVGILMPDSSANYLKEYM